jgi:hypothetical protein
MVKLLPVVMGDRSEPSGSDLNQNAQCNSSKPGEHALTSRPRSSKQTGGRLLRLDFPPPQAFVPPQAGRAHTMVTPTTEITLRAMRAKLEEAAAIARAAEGLAADGQPGRALAMVLDVEPLALEANVLLQGLAVLSRIVREEQDEAQP